MREKVNYDIINNIILFNAVSPYTPDGTACPIMAPNAKSLDLCGS